MTELLANDEKRVAGFIDLGTNSARLRVAEIGGDGSVRILSAQKIPVRLGDGEFRSGRLSDAAMERTISALMGFKELCDRFGASEIIAYATSATRDAENQGYFIQKIKKEADIRVKVISGQEEARLIYKGVASEFAIGRKKALFIDIGGGSTEVSIGTQFDFSYLNSLNVGAIRLYNEFFNKNHGGTVSAELFSKMCRHVRDKSLRVVQKVREEGFQICFGSSGTVKNLQELAARYVVSSGQEELSVEALEELAKKLCSMTLEERKRLAGLSDMRADIIVPGAAILLTLMREFNAAKIIASKNGLLEGMIQDYIFEHVKGHGKKCQKVRESSVLELARSFNFDEIHCMHVAEICDNLFTSSKDIKLHDMEDKERELCRYAAILHDIGMAIAYRNHDVHSHYLIKNSELLGFHGEDMEIMALCASAHKARYGKKSTNFKGLSLENIKIVDMISVFLRIAESLDRSHRKIVASAKFSKETGIEEGLGKLYLDIALKNNDDWEIERSSLASQLSGFKQVFGENLKVRLYDRRKFREIEF